MSEPAQGIEVIQPGRDATEHADSLHNGVSPSINEILREPLPVDSTKPGAEQSLPDIRQSPNLMSKFKNWLAIMKGGSGATSSNGFLRKLAARVRMAHPNKEVVVKEE